MQNPTDASGTVRPMANVPTFLHPFAKPTRERFISDRPR